MVYRVRYYREGAMIGSAPWAASLEETKQFARDGMIRHRADSADIVDVDGDGSVVWSEHHNA